MAKSLDFSIFMAILLATLMVSPTFSQEDVNPSPEPEDKYSYLSPGESIDADPPAVEYDNQLLHEFSSDYLDFIQSCADKISAECGTEVFVEMLHNKPVKEECCKSLLKAGKECHLGLTKIIFSTYEFKGNASVGVARSKQVWNKCALEVGAQIGAPVPLEI